MKKALSYLLIIISLLCSCSQKETNPLLEELDAALAEKETYHRYFTERVGVLKSVLADKNDTEHKYNIYLRLAESYKAHCFDSTLFYLRECRTLALKMEDQAKTMATDFMTAELYSKAGYYVEAGEILRQYRQETILSEIEYEYIKACNVYYGETMAYASTEESHEKKRRMRDAYRARLIDLVPENSIEWYDLKREEAESAGNRDLMREYAEKMLDACEPDSHEYAKACYMYAYTFPGDDYESRCEWLARSAIADAKCCITDYMALNSLSELLFEHGEIEKAFRYVADHCIVDALHYNGRLRPWQISRFFPKLEKAYTEKNIQYLKTLRIFIIFILVFLVALILLLTFIYKRQRVLVATQEKLKDSYIEIDKRNIELIEINNKLIELNAKIHEADKVKQEYITLFLGILSENINKTRQYKNHVLKNIRQGNSKKLVDEIENLPPVDEDIHEFYRMFDQTFVNLYPDFVAQFNKLLQEGSQIVPKGDDILTPELRIFALIKLGITDSSKIATLLHYSANTIYNYRAKTKNKARCSRDKFEDTVRNIE